MLTSKQEADLSEGAEARDGLLSLPIHPLFPALLLLPPLLSLLEDHGEGGIEGGIDEKK